MLFWFVSIVLSSVVNARSSINEFKKLVEVGIGAAIVRSAAANWYWCSHWWLIPVVFWASGIWSCEIHPIEASWFTWLDAKEITAALSSADCDITSFPRFADDENWNSLLTKPKRTMFKQWKN